MSDMVARIQQKCQVTIPSAVRRKLKLRKGDLVKFVETENGVLIKPAEVIVSDALDEIGKALEARGLSLEEMIEEGRKIRSDLVEEEC